MCLGSTTSVPRGILECYWRLNPSSGDGNTHNLSTSLSAHIGHVKRSVREV